jgi:hypothetical protein
MNSDLLRKQAEAQAEELKEQISQEFAKKYADLADDEFFEKVRRDLTGGGITDNRPDNTAGQPFDGSDPFDQNPFDTSSYRSKPKIYDPFLNRIIRQSSIFKGYELDYLNDNSQYDIKGRSRETQQKVQDILERINEEKDQSRGWRKQTPDPYENDPQKYEYVPDPGDRYFLEPDDGTDDLPF